MKIEEIKKYLDSTSLDDVILGIRLITSYHRKKIWEEVSDKEYETRIKKISEHIIIITDSGIFTMENGVGGIYIYDDSHQKTVEKVIEVNFLGEKVEIKDFRDESKKK